MASQFHISLSGAEAVVMTTVLVYLAFIVLLRILGQRSLGSMSTFDFAAVTAFGAVLGRTALLENFDLMNALVALVTLCGMQATLRLLRRYSGINRLLLRPAVMLVIDGRILHENMRRAKVVEDDLRQAVRDGGLPGLAHVRCVVLERNGSLSLIATEETVDPWLVRDVAGLTRNPDVATG